MIFMQDEIIFWEWMISNPIMFVVSGILISELDGAWIIWLIMLLSVISYVIEMVIFITNQKLVIVNEEGISCQKGEKLLWSYKWSEIQELWISLRYHSRSVEIILKPEYRNDKNTYEIQPYFQLGLMAKKAIKIYSKCPINKKNRPNK